MKNLGKLENYVDVPAHTVKSSSVDKPKTSTPRLQLPTLSRRTLPPNHSLKLSALSVMSFMHSIGAQYLWPYDVKKRLKHIKEQKGCANCLQLTNCPSPYNCKHCKGRHNTLLHREETPTGTTSGLIATSSSKTLETEAILPPDITFLNTAMVTAINGSRSCMAHIAIDTGAKSSLISEALASHLKVRRHPHRLAIERACSNGVSKHYIQVTFQSNVDPIRSTTVRLSVIPKLPSTHPQLRKDDIAANPQVKDLQLADPDFGGPLEALIKGMDSWKCFTGSFKYHPEPDILISPNYFWLDNCVSVRLYPSYICPEGSPETGFTQQALQKLWELDKLPDTPNLDPANEAVVHHFEDTHSIQSDERYVVRLPKKTDAPELGTSRHIAIRRFIYNEKSMEKKGKLQDFNLAMQSLYPMLNLLFYPTTCLCTGFSKRPRQLRNSPSCLRRLCSIQQWYVTQ